MTEIKKMGQFKMRRSLRCRKKKVREIIQSETDCTVPRYVVSMLAMSIYTIHRAIITVDLESHEKSR